MNTAITLTIVGVLAVAWTWASFSAWRRRSTADWLRRSNARCVRELQRIQRHEPNKVMEVNE